MFAKLLKHELKSTGGLMGILSAAALGVGVIGGLLLRYIIHASSGSNAEMVMPIVAAIAIPFVFLSLLAYAFGGEIYVVIQLYKRKFTDQGYLTFTLPVRTWQIYLSSLLNMLLWMLVILIVTVLSFFLTFFVGIFGTEVWNEMIAANIDLSLQFSMIYPEFSVWNVLYVIASFLSSNVLVITAMTLGCVAAKKHKILASIGFYYLITVVINVINSIISFSYLLMADLNMISQVYVVTTLTQLFIAAAGSVLSVWLMDKKLNLP